MKFANGMTVKELKNFIKDWPEENMHGEPTEVWFNTDKFHSSQVTEMDKLNVNNGTYDILFS